VIKIGSEFPASPLVSLFIAVQFGYKNEVVIKDIRAIVDTGSSITTLSRDLWRQLYEAFLKLNAVDDGYGMSVDLLALPFNPMPESYPVQKLLCDATVCGHTFTKVWVADDELPNGIPCILGNDLISQGVLILDLGGSAHSLTYHVPVTQTQEPPVRWN